MNAFRKLLIEKLEANGGYSSGYHDRFAIEYTVGLYYADTDIEDLAKVGEEHHGLDMKLFELIRDDLDWDGDKEWQHAQEDMYWGLKNGDDCAWTTYSLATANMFGLPYDAFPKKYKRLTNECAYYPASKPGWILDNPYTCLNFDAKFGLYGRGGKHLCIEEFEGVKLKLSNQELIESIEDPDRYYGAPDYSNTWCRNLLAMMTEWEVMFTSKNASKELEYQMAYRLATLMEEHVETEEFASKIWQQRQNLGAAAH